MTGDFAKKQAGSGLRVLESKDLEQLEANIHALTPQFMPCVADGLHWLVSVGRDGTRYLTIFNNEGNDRDMKLGNIIDRKADRRVKVTFQDAAKLSTVRSYHDDVTLERADDRTWYVNVPAAQMVILAF